MSIKSSSVVISIAVSCWMAALFVQCDNGNGPAPAVKPIEILAPKGGETYISGQTVEIKWKINDLSKIGSVGIKLSLDSGRTFLMYDLEPTSIFPPTTSFLWTIDAAQVSNHCLIKVYEYSLKSPYDKSGIFSVTN